MKNIQVSRLHWKSLFKFMLSNFWIYYLVSNRDTRCVSCAWGLSLQVFSPCSLLSEIEAPYFTSLLFRRYISLLLLLLSTAYALFIFAVTCSQFSCYFRSDEHLPTWIFSLKLNVFRVMELCRASDVFSSWWCEVILCYRMLVMTYFDREMKNVFQNRGKGSFYTADAAILDYLLL